MSTLSSNPSSSTRPHAESVYTHSVSTHVRMRIVRLSPFQFPDYPFHLSRHPRQYAMTTHSRTQSLLDKEARAFPSAGLLTLRPSLPAILLSVHNELRFLLYSFTVHNFMPAFPLSFSSSFVCVPIAWRGAAMMDGS